MPRARRRWSPYFCPVIRINILKMKNLTNQIVTRTIFRRQNIKPVQLIMKRALLLLVLTAFLSLAHAQIRIDTSAYVKDNKQLYSVVVSQNDAVIFSQYFNNKTDMYSRMLMNGYSQKLKGKHPPTTCPQTW